MIENQIEERLNRIERLVMIGAKEVLTASEVALLLGISESRVRHKASNLELPYYKYGKSLYFKKSEIEATLLKDKVESQHEINSRATTWVAIKSN